MSLTLNIARLLYIWMCLCVLEMCITRKERGSPVVVVAAATVVDCCFLSKLLRRALNECSFVRPHIIFWVDFSLDLLLFLFTSEHINALFSIALQCWKNISESESRYDKSSSIKCRRPQLVYILWRRRLFVSFLFFFVGKILNIVFMLSVCFSRV